MKATVNKASELTIGGTSHPASRRLIGIDVARGVALIGLVTVHILPAWHEATGEASVSWILFSGHSAALFALLAGVSLGLGTGGSTPHRGQRMTAGRIALAVRALLVGLAGLAVATVMPVENPPAYGILLYYAMFFLVSIPFLHMSMKALCLWATGFAVVSPVLMQQVQDLLPEFVSYNPTFTDVVTEPVGLIVQLLVTGVYPALPYMAYMLVGLAVGRLDLRAGEVAARLLAAGVTLAAFAKFVSYLLLYGAGGYYQLLASSGMNEYTLWETLVWGPEVLPNDTAWWLVITTPHTNTPLAIMFSLGVSLAVLGACLFLARKAEKVLVPLAAMGAMTFTLYTVHLLVLAMEIHYDLPARWFILHLVVAAILALAWRKAFGQGPLERVVSMSAKGTRALVTRTPAPAASQG